MTTMLWNDECLNLGVSGVVVHLKVIWIHVLCHQTLLGLVNSLAVFIDHLLLDDIWTEIIVQEPRSALFNSPPGISPDFAILV